MKKLLLVCCSFVFAAGTLFADSEKLAGVWANENRAELDKQNSPAELTAILQGGAAKLDPLFANVKPNGETCPFAGTQIASLSQFVMLPAQAAFRKPYAAALLAAAQKATEPEVICFFLYQLRWCGLPEQADAIAAFEKSDKTGVADLAAMVVTAVKDEGIGVHCAVPPAASPAKPEETAKTVAALAAAKDPVEKIRLIDALGVSRDKSAVDALAAQLKDENGDVVDAAFLALGHISPDAIASRVADILQTATPNSQGPILTALRQLATAQLKQPVIASYASFNPIGKKIALELIAQRRIMEGASIGIDGIASDDAETQVNAYRLLRDIGGKEQAPALLAKAFSTKGRVTPEAESALVAIAKVDGGIIGEALVGTIRGTNAAAKEIALETSSRIGGKALMEAAASVARGKNAEAAANAVRALSDWLDNSTVPVLLSLAASSQESKCRKLALAGLQRKLGVTGANKEPFAPTWRMLREKAVDPQIKKAVDSLFTKEENILKGKKVVTNVPDEGGNAAANLTDGTLANAWHGHGMPGVATVDIGCIIPVNAAHVTFYYADSRTYTFKLELSVDGKVWKSVGGNEADAKPATREGIRIEFSEMPARYVRLTVLKNSANPYTHVLELEVFHRVAM